MNPLIVYRMTESKIEILDTLQGLQTLSYTVCFDDLGSFTLTLPFSQKDFKLLLPENRIEKIILLENSVFGICHKVEARNGDNKTITVEGNLIEGLLLNSVVNRALNLSEDTELQEYTYNNIYGKESSNIYSISTLWNGLTFEKNSDLKKFIIPAGYNFEGGTLADFITQISVYSNKGFKVYKKPDDSFGLKYLDYTDRSINQKENSPVLISTKFDNLSEGQFSINTQKYKNVVIASCDYANDNFGNGKLTVAVTYDKYGDDITKISSNEIRAAFESDLGVDQTKAKTLEEFETLLKQAARQKLYEYNLVKSYECMQVDQVGTFLLNRDYFLGDKVTVYDDYLDLSIDVQIKSITTNISNAGREKELSFGYSQPTLNQILRKKGVI